MDSILYFVTYFLCVCGKLFCGFLVEENLGAILQSGSSAVNKKGIPSKLLHLRSLFVSLPKITKKLVQTRPVCGLKLKHKRIMFQIKCKPHKKLLSNEFSARIKLK